MLMKIGENLRGQPSKIESEKFAFAPPIGEEYQLRLSRFLTGSVPDRLSLAHLDTICTLTNQSACQAQPSLGHKKVKKPLQEFLTGSRYVGEWNALGFTGHGLYRYPHGVIYEGEFNKRGEFHGIGTLLYPGGQKLQGMWKNGRLLEDATFTFSCGEILDENLKYCQAPDRRFHIELFKDFGPAGQEYLTNSQQVKKIPEGCYDVVGGIYNPKAHIITSPVIERSKTPKKIVYPQLDETKLADFEEITADTEKVFEEISGFSRYEMNSQVFRDNKLELTPQITRRAVPTSEELAEDYIEESGNNPIRYVCRGHVPTCKKFVFDKKPRALQEFEENNTTNNSEESGQHPVLPNTSSSFAKGYRNFDVSTTQKNN